jgi:uncharacterized protein (DUF952 family)
MAEPLFKILTESAFMKALGDGRFESAADDRRDGFIHLSAGHQLQTTLAAHFAGAGDLLLVAVDSARFGEELKWEPSRGGELFPHLYAPLDLAAVLWVEKLPLDRDGRHVLPTGVAA